MTLVTVVDLPGAVVATVVFDVSILTGTSTGTVVLRLAWTVVCDIDSTDTGTVVIDLRGAGTVVCDVDRVFTFGNDGCCTLEINAVFVLGKVITPFGSRSRSTCSLFRFIIMPCSSKMILK